jgi:hypothetical protein
LQQDHDFASGLARISSIISRWANAEKRVLSRRDRDFTREYEGIEEKLVDLYTSNLEYQVAVNQYCRKSVLGHYLPPSLTLVLLAYIPLGRLVGAAYSPELIGRILADVARRDEICKDMKGILDSDTAFQKENTKILQWLCKENPTDAHLSMQSCTKTDEESQTCGKWFFESEQFKEWDRPSQATAVLWLCGTGMQFMSSPRCRLTYLNWQWEPASQH